MIINCYHISNGNLNNMPVFVDLLELNPSNSITSVKDTSWWIMLVPLPRNCFEHHSCGTAPSTRVTAPVAFNQTAVLWISGWWLVVCEISHTAFPPQQIMVKLTKCSTRTPPKLYCLCFVSCERCTSFYSAFGIKFDAHKFRRNAQLQINQTL